MADPKIHFTASAKPEARQALEAMTRRYGQTAASKADVIVALGGDGWMLETLRGRYADKLPVYGMHRGTVGFLMNEFAEADLPARLDAAVRAVIHPLAMTAISVKDKVTHLQAINEVSLLRQTAQTAKLRISVDGKERLADLLGEAGESRASVHFGELVGLGAQHRRHVVLHRRGRGPVDAHEQHGRRQDEQHRVEQRQAEARRAQDPSQARG